MSSRKVYLTYSTDNNDVADKLVADLGRVGIEFIQDTRNPVTKAAIESRMAEDNAPIYILVSDNFLKSVDCMEGALKFIDNFKFRPRIKPIVIDGRTQNKETGAYEYEATKFDKVSNVIKYMNYWQDEYLRLRREKRDVPYAEEAEFQARVDRIRRISNEIGEFLRSLRSFTYTELTTLEENKFKRFFDGLGFEGGEFHQQYSALPELTFVSSVEEPEEGRKSMLETLIETADAKEEEAVVENEIKEEITEEVILGDIPGMEGLYEEPELMKSVDYVTEEAIENEAAPTDDEMEQAPSDSYQSMEDFVEQMTEESVEEVADELEATVEESVEEIADELEATIEESVEEIADELEATIEESVEEVADELEVTIEESVEEVADELEATIEESVEEVADELEATIEESVEEVADEVEATIEESVEEVADKLEATIEESVEEVADELEATVEESVEEVADEITVIRTPEMILEEAELHIEAGEYAAAKESYQLLMLKSDDPSIRIAYAALLQDYMGDTVTAKEHLEELMLQDKATAEVYCRLGQIAETNEEYLAAKNYFERAISVDGNCADAYHELGLIISNHFDNQAFVAKSYLQEAITLSPENATFRHDLAMFLISQGEYKKARKQLLEVIDLEEDDASTYMVLAGLYLNKLNKPKKARKYYLKATELEEGFCTEAADELYGVERIDEAEEEELAMSRVADETGIDKEVKTILITGATSGIGLATARLFASQGHRLILTGRRADRLAGLKEGFEEEFGVEVATLNFDVRNNEATENSLNALTEEWKNIDILINNAGLAKGFSPVHEGLLSHWETMIDTNIKGLLYVSRVVTPWMVERGSGQIINIASIAGKEAYPNGAVYCATKAAVDQLTKGMRLDLHKYNIRVASISPAHVEETEFALVRFDGDAERAKIYNDFQPINSEDIANTINFIVAQPAHVSIHDVVISSTQQASATVINRSGRLIEE